MYSQSTSLISQPDKVKLNFVKEKKNLQHNMFTPLAIQWMRWVGVCCE